MNDLQSNLDALAAAFGTERAESIKRLTGVCPHCGAHSAFEQISQDKLLGLILLTRGAANRLLFQGSCYACQGLIIVASVYVPARETSPQSLELRLLWPRTIRPSKSPRELPAELQRDYDQARTVLADSPMAAATLARRCVQYVIRTKMGIEDRDLFSEIKQAILRPELTAATRESLDHVRKIGNWAAHPSLDAANTIIEVSPEEASYTLDVLELLFHDLYVTPANVWAMRKRIEAR